MWTEQALQCLTCLYLQVTSVPPVACEFGPPTRREDCTTILLTENGYLYAFQVDSKNRSFSDNVAEVKVQLCFQQKEKVSDCILGAWWLLTALFHFPHVVLTWNYSRKWSSETADTWFDYSVTSGSMATIPWTGRIKLWELTTKNENETLEQFKKTKALFVEVFRSGVFSQKIVLAPFHCLL